MEPRGGAAGPVAEGDGLRFVVEPTDGPPALTVCGRVHSLDGEDVPQGVYTWHFDDHVFTADMASEGSVSHTFGNSGKHLVALTLTIAGVTMPVACQAPDGKSKERAEVTVWPTVSGYVVTESGDPIAGVTVALDETELRTTTDRSGAFVLGVPPGSSGTVRPALAGGSFSPSAYRLNALERDAAGVVFKLLGDDVPPAAPGQDDLAEASVTTLEDTELRVVLAETEIGVGASRFRITGLPAHGTLTDPEAGQVIAEEDLPYSLLDALGSMTYMPKADYNDAEQGDTVSIEVEFANEDTVPANLTVLVMPVNDAPSFRLPRGPVDARVGQLTRVVIRDVQAGPPDEADQEVTFEATSSDEALLPGENVFFAGNDLHFRPLAIGPVALTVLAQDDGGVADGGIDRSEPQVLEIDVRQPEVPSADDKYVRVTRSTPKYITLSGRDSLGYSSLEPLGDALSFSLETEPAHGTLHGASPELVYVPDPGYVGSDSFDFAVAAGGVTGKPGTVSLDVRPWTAPIGVPDPGFGITDVAPGWPEGWPASEVAGHYYVDNTHPAATDAANAYGYPDRPRQTIPWPLNLQPGTYVEIAGGPYACAMRFKIVGGGSADAPAWIRGASVASRPWLQDSFELYSGGSGHIYIENLKISGQVMACATYGHHIVVRHCELTGRSGGGSVLGIRGCTSTAQSTHDVVVYNNLIHDNGDWLADFDEDAHGIGVIGYTNNIWIVDNEFYHNSGNGVQVNAGQVEWEDTTHHVYVARNEAHHNKQAGIWCKLGHDIIFSQNRCYSYRPVGENPSNFGDGMGGQYGPENLWYLYNEIFDCSNGIRLSSQGGGHTAGTGENIYMIGNLIYDIHHPTVDLTGQYPVAGGTDYDPHDPWGPGKGIAIWHTTAVKHLINNTIFDADAALAVTRQDNAVVAVNNIFANLNDGESDDTPHVHIEHDSSAGVCELRHNMFDGPATIKWGYAALVSGMGLFEAQHSDVASGNIEADWTTLFVNPDQPGALMGGLRLESGAAAIDSGIADEAYATFEALYGLDITVDFDGEGRPVGPWDIGAYEH